MLDGNMARDGKDGRRRSTTRGSRGLTTASPSPASVGGVVAYAMITDCNPCVGYCGVVNVVCYE